MKLKQFLLINRLIDIQNIIEVPSDIVNDEEIMHEYHSIRQNMDNIEIEPINEDDKRTSIEDRAKLTDQLSLHLLTINDLIRKDLKETGVQIPYSELKKLESALQKWVYYSYYQMGKKDD